MSKRTEAVKKITDDIWDLLEYSGTGVTYIGSNDYLKDNMRFIIKKGVYKLLRENNKQFNKVPKTKSKGSLK
jgi:hypothetical protein